MSNDLIMVGVVICLFALFFIKNVEANTVKRLFTAHLLEKGGISESDRKRYLDKPEMEAIRLINLDYRVGVSNASKIYQALKQQQK